MGLTCFPAWGESIFKVFKKGKAMLKAVRVVDKVDFKLQDANETELIT